jgi:CHAD domain-containing protein
MPQAVESGQFVTEQATRLLDGLASQASSTLHSKGADSVHDLRVAIRRFAQALAVFKPYFPARESRKIRRNLKEIMSFAGEVRDRDIAIELLADSKSAEAAALEVKLREQREEAETVLLAVLRRWGARKSTSKWRGWLLPVQPATAELERPLIRMAEKFFQSGDQAASAHSSVNDLHRFRIRSKKFRYSVELFRPVYGAVAEEWVGQIKRIQTLLGDMNDYRVARELIAELDPDASIASSFKQKQQKKADAFRKLWNEEYSGAAKQWVRSLERTPRKPVARAGAGTAALTLAAR